MKRKTTRLY